MATTICSSVKSSLPAWQCSQLPALFHCSHPGFSLSRQGLQSRASAARSMVIHWPQGKGKGAFFSGIEIPWHHQGASWCPREAALGSSAPDFQAVSSLMDSPPCRMHPRDVCFAASQAQVLRLSRHCLHSDPLPQCEGVRWWTLPRPCVPFIPPVKS